MCAGVRRSPNGSVYEGDFKQGVMHGIGTLTDAAGAVYTGAFSDDRQNGRGRIEYKNGDWFEGNFESGKRQGRGTIYFAAKGAKYHGTWLNDDIVGPLSPVAPGSL